MKKHNLELESENGLVTHVYLDGNEIECKSFSISQEGSKPLIANLEIFCLGGIKACATNSVVLIKKDE